MSIAINPMDDQPCKQMELLTARLRAAIDDLLTQCEESRRQVRERDRLIACCLEHINTLGTLAVSGVTGEADKA